MCSSLGDSVEKKMHRCTDIHIDNFCYFEANENKTHSSHKSEDLHNVYNLGPKAIQGKEDSIQCSL